MLYITGDTHNTEVQMFGSTVLKVGENIFYLKRGEVYIMDEKKILVLGGARSDDMAYRKIHESWWPEEDVQLL